jgi:hypothetical protein
MGKSFPSIALILAFLILVIPIFAASANTGDTFELGDPGFLPNSFWYNFEIAKERIVIIFTFSNLSKANKLMSLATERLSELKKMIEIGDIKNARKTIDRYKAEVDESGQNLADCNKNDGKVQSQFEKNRMTAAWQEEQLIDFKKNAPKELEPDINSAIQKATDIINMKCN